MNQTCALGEDHRRPLLFSALQTEGSGVQQESEHTPTPDDCPGPSCTDTLDRASLRFVGEGLNAAPDWDCNFKDGGGGGRGACLCGRRKTGARDWAEVRGFHIIFFVKV